MKRRRNTDTELIKKRKIQEETNAVKNAIQSLIIRKTLGASILMNERSRIS